MYNIKYNFEIEETAEFTTWLKSLHNVDARARINVRLRRLSLTGNYGDAKSIGGGIYELRLDMGPGYRIYFAKRRRKQILLLIGGDKSTQIRDIDKARRLKSVYLQKG